MNGRKVVKDFDDYMSFTQAWKQAKYVTEQQLMLTQEAFERGVIAGKTICIHQVCAEVLSLFGAFPGSPLHQLAVVAIYLIMSAVELTFPIQPAKSKRWAFKDPGALDADVLELVFKFDAATYTVSMQVGFVPAISDCFRLR